MPEIGLLEKKADYTLVLLPFYKRKTSLRIQREGYVKILVSKKAFRKLIKPFCPLTDEWKTMCGTYMSSVQPLRLSCV